ncbi:MAG: hypothetical protein M5U09_26730, partial [Gammaproteobacteria bacterium]|nr:hypothetical protein [Gammaproteobacteria bacterium]
ATSGGLACSGGTCRCWCSALSVVLVARRLSADVPCVLCWNAVTYLPVLPLHDNVPWYQYIPDLLDRAFTVLAAAAIVRSLWSWWEENSR